MKSCCAAIGCGVALSVVICAAAVFALPFLPERVLEIFIDTPA